MISSETYQSNNPLAKFPPQPKLRGEQWLTYLLKLARWPSIVHVKEPEENHQSSSLEPAELPNYWLIIDHTKLTSSQLQSLKQPELLDAIQYLANAALNLDQEPEDHAFYTVELNNYRVERQAVIQELALLAVAKVRATGQSEEIRDLSSAERRHIHSFLKDYPDLETFSRGEEPDRCLIVKPKP